MAEGQLGNEGEKLIRSSGQKCTLSGPVSSGCFANENPSVRLPAPQSTPMDLRIGQPGPDAAILTLKQTHELQKQLFIASFHQQQFSPPQLHSSLRLNMESQHQDTDLEKQHQELRQLWNKDRNKQSAVASTAVKQKLQEVILKKQQAALKRITDHPMTNPTVTYRAFPQEETPQTVLPSPAPTAAANPGETQEDFPLRKTSSEPNLKVRYKLKKAVERRKSPLTRKESAPPTLKKRPSETLDSSPSSSSTPVSGCSSPNDSLPTESNKVLPMSGISHESSLAQRLMMQEGSLAQFPIQSASSLPTITLGLPATARGDAERHNLTTLSHRVPVLNGPILAGAHPPVIIPAGLDRDPGSSLLPRLQPVIILEQSLTSSPMVTGLGSVPFHFAHPLIHADRVATVGHHKPLGRTRSEPIPQNPKLIQQHLLTQHQHAQFLEKLKQQTHLGKLMAKSSEKPRLRQIPSEDLDPEEGGQGEDRASKGAGERAEPPRGRVKSLNEGRSDSHRDGADGDKEQERTQQLILQQQEELILQQQAYLWEQHQRIQHLRRHTQMETLGIPMVIGGHRPLSRAQSSPASASVSLPVQEPPTKAMSLPVQEQSSKPCFTTGLVYDSVMLKHQCTCGDNSNHPEHAGRIQSIWSRLQETGLRGQCECVRGRKASLEELQSVHTERHVLLYGTNPLNRLKLDNRKLAGILSQRMFVMLPCGGVGVDSDTIWNEMHSSNAARWAAGSVIELAFKVAAGELKNGFAIVRPPGHHAEPSSAMGFCFFNSLAITAKQLQQKLNASKILIVDWDVHHGNGTQQIFYQDPNVLYISLHRYDNGTFFPGSGASDEVGSGPGEGFNVNVAWMGGLDPPMADPEYLAAFRTIVMPIAHEFSPDVVLVSAGFDAADGHPPPLGGYKVSAKCFGYMTRQLMSLAGGRVILALEGGHDLTAICDASEACVSALLGKELDPFPEEVVRQRPNPNAICSLETVIRLQSKYWKSVQRFASTLGYSFLESQKHDKDEAETVTALASLSVGVNHRVIAEKRPPDEPMEEEEPMNL
nr:PREDICTED: histone deacetylase 7 isoform X3 [Latimeria chalumnae]XP_014340347.1 PREDICTED: histone deacetylase 7 isoform X3 [Latimeria chalumnae]XP_014340353.1 PREDICTED: histone deacetylase 7 isoform X3 [Latimeria chalumnae]|eukprot:XP_014340344.1 PREDICTED: histone deacetylase 7 isoform X3 [Latimeria chalumnae]